MAEFPGAEALEKDAGKGHYQAEVKTFCWVIVSKNIRVYNVPIMVTGIVTSHVRAALFQGYMTMS